MLQKAQVALPNLSINNLRDFTALMRALPPSAPAPIQDNSLGATKAPKQVYEDGGKLLPNPDYTHEAAINAPIYVDSATILTVMGLANKDLLVNAGGDVVGVNVNGQITKVITADKNVIQQLADTK